MKKEEGIFKNLDIEVFNNKSIGRVINIIRFMILKNEMPIPSMKVLNSGTNTLLNPKSVNPSMVWGDYCIKRYLDKLYFLKLSELQPNQSNRSMNWSIDKPLVLDENGSTLTAIMVKGQGLSLKKCNKNLDVQLQIHNLLNTEYWSSASSWGFQTGTPRNSTFSLSYRF